MGVLNIIRRMALREKLPRREIARRTGMSRNTIRKYLNAGTIEPQVATPQRQSKLEPFSEKLVGWLNTEAGKSRKQRQTFKQMHADLVVLGDLLPPQVRLYRLALVKVWPFFDL